MNDVTKTSSAAIHGAEHWASKDGGVKLFLFEKCAGDPKDSIGTILFVHGSSMAAQPTFDLQVEGRPDSSVMDWFARRGFDCWCADMEGYGRSAKDRDNNAPIAQGAEYRRREGVHHQETGLSPEETDLCLRHRSVHAQA